MKPDHLYVIGDGSGAVKIGRSADPGNRLSGLQVGSPRPLTILCIIEAAGHLERAIQGRFADIHLHREWFDFGDADAAAVVREVVEELASEAGAECGPEQRSDLLAEVIAWKAEQDAVTAERDPLVRQLMSSGLFTKEEVHIYTGLGRNTIDRITTPKEPPA